MLKNFAIIENGIIVNVIVSDDDFIAQNYPQAIECPSFVGVGDKYENGEFSRNTIEIPPKVEDEAEAL